MLYLTMTKTGIPFCVQTLSQFLQDPKKLHMEAALKVVKYVKGQSSQGVLLSSGSDNRVGAYYDADWASCPQSKRSMTIYFVEIRELVVS